MCRPKYIQPDSACQSYGIVIRKSQDYMYMQYQKSPLFWLLSKSQLCKAIQFPYPFTVLNTCNLLLNCHLYKCNILRIGRLNRKDGKEKRLFYNQHFTSFNCERANHRMFTELSKMPLNGGATCIQLSFSHFLVVLITELNN